MTTERPPSAHVALVAAAATLHAWDEAERMPEPQELAELMDSIDAALDTYEPVTAVEILDWIAGARGRGFTAESALFAATDFVWSAALKGAHDDDGEPYRPAGDARDRCPLEGCTLPPHPAGTKHYTWRELARGGTEEISG